MSDKRFEECWSADSQFGEFKEAEARKAAIPLLDGLVLPSTRSGWMSLLAQAFGRGFHCAIRNYDRMKVEWEQRTLLPNAPDQPPAAETPSEPAGPNCRSVASDGSAN